MTTTRQEDINHGRATVRAHADGGWALPGGDVTHDPAVATWIAVEIDRLIGDSLTDDNKAWLDSLRERSTTSMASKRIVTAGIKSR